ncbi:MAG: translocation/assembly module TamB [Parachlamydiaceae bacterium]|nr:translocation/assembly module TamB [Parachlamydiaceae bacterium]
MKKWIFYIFLSLLVGTFLVAIAQRNRIKDYAIASLVAQIQTQTGCQVKLEEVELSLPLSLSIKHLAVCQENAPIAHIDNLQLVLHPWDFWYSGVVIHAIYMERAHFEAFPQCTSSSAISSSAIPENKPYIDLQDLQIDHFTISKNIQDHLPLEYRPFLHHPLIVHAKASLDPYSQEALIDISLADVQTPHAKTHLVAAFSEQEDNVQLQARLIESDQGLISKQHPLLPGYAFHASMQAAAPKESWNALISYHLPEHEIIGDLQISYHTDSAPELEEELLGNNGSLELPFHLGAYGIRISNLVASLGDTAVEGSFSLTPELQLDNTHLQLKIPTINWQGTIALTSRDIHVESFLSGSLFNPIATLKLHAEELSLNQENFQKIKAHVVLHKLQEEINGTLTFQSQYLKQPLYFSAAFSWDKLLSLFNAQTIFGATHVIGDLEIDLSSKLVSGELSGTTDLSLFASRLMQNDLKGALSFQSRFNHSNGTQTALVTAQIPSIQSKDLQAEQTNLSTTLIDPFGNLKANLQLNCQSATYSTQTANDIDFHSAIDTQSTDWPCALSFVIHEKLRLESQGTCYLSPKTFKLNLNSLSGNIQKYPFSLKKPLYLEWSDSFFISPLDIVVGKGSVQATTTFAKNDLQLALRAENIPMDLLRVLHPSLNLNGTGAAEITLTQSPEDTEGNLLITLQDVHMLDDELGNIIPIQVELAAQLAKGALSCKGSITGVGPQPVAVTATLPVSFTISPFDLHIDKKKPINAHLALQGPLEPVLELFMPATGPAITGHAQIALDITGTFARTHVKGYADISHGSFDIPGIGLSFREIQGHIDLVDKKATITSLNGTDGYDGHFRGQGSVDLDSNKGFPFDFAFIMDQALLSPSDYASARTSGNLHYFGNINAATLSGKVISGMLRITIPKQIPELMQTVEVSYINQPESSPKPTVYQPKSAESYLTLDLELDVPKHGIISGQDWSSEWKGNVAITGSPTTPLLNGTCRIIKGEYRYNGKSFDIREGTISFAGDPEKKTSLYIIASKDIGEITAEIILKGSLRAPAISFRSNPPLPQREIVSWILFNRGTRDISTFQGSQLNESITDLNMGDSKPDVLTRFRERIGIDKIDISRENSNSNEVSVQVGKYISRGILVSVNKSVTAEANRLAIEADVARNVKVQAQVGDDSEGQLQLKWKHDY